jgi:hypothetical protein
MNAINTHEYKEAINTKRVFHKTGEASILWGFFKYPEGWHEEKRTHLGLCVRCGEREFTAIHGYHSPGKP